MRSSFIVVLASLAAIKASAWPTIWNGLDSAIRAKGKEHVGSALTLGTDSRTEDIMKGRGEFGAMTPENAMKWESVQPSRGNFTFDDADRHAEFAVKHKKTLRCHTLVWHTLNEDGTYRETVWYKTIGEAYIPMAFRLAAKADPKAKLWYNDYNLEFNDAKTAAAARLVKLVRSYGVRIDGVGLQGHLVGEPTPTQSNVAPSLETLERSLRQFTDLGALVEYTEVDIRLNTPATRRALQEQSKAYQRVIGSCMAVRKCIGFTLWVKLRCLLLRNMSNSDQGVSDKYSWIPYTFEGEGAALAWDDDFKKKPAYWGILKAIKTAKWWHGHAKE
ncbi:hypothetical protein FZEAL_467 [Fusarium zealandicum]|uniref:endo-1,4-beta-xylanase n=1 Tax=Fusarium zealandicum TaxID=1053134 RepID=A0A8H4UUP6_9HYPO|nr:hypothetical protein FZEAL_467 [Fusarium zealandicum]